jgi:hypothetical protein
MLSQKFQPGDAETQREKEFIYRDGVDESDLIRVSVFLYPRSSSLSPLNIALRLCVFALIICSLSCGAKPTDLRTIIPADSLFYLETNDLGKTLTAVTENEAFKAAAKTQPDFSALGGIKLAVAVTGFETKEQQVTEENSVLNFKPRFVAVVETNAWNYQALSFTENKLGEFINETYGGEVTLETSDKHGGKYFVWTAQDGRKAFALVLGSLIFFGNDESAIEKCLAVTRGETDGIAKNPKIAALSADSLASGYVSTDGVAQISNIAGISLALGASEEGEVKSFIARVLPEMLRKAVIDVTWSAVKTERGIEDKFLIATNAEVSAVLKETLVPVAGSMDGFKPFLQYHAAATTRYSLQNPQIAWRTVVLTAQKQTDAVSGDLIASFSDSVFEPYGVDNGELFLSSVGSQIFTVRYDAEGEKQVIIAEASKLEDLKRSVAKELNVAKVPVHEHGADVWRSEDGEIALVSVDGKVILGDPEAALRCLEMYRRGEDIKVTQYLQPLAATTAAAATIGSEMDMAGKIADSLSERKNKDEQFTSSYFTETRFNQNGIHRRTISDFGLIGRLIETLESEK